MGGEDNPVTAGMGGGGGSVPGAAGGGSFMRSARRRAIAQTMRPNRVKHGLMHAPSIAHSHNGTGTSPPKFGGSFKPQGY